jgi:hypothetical protein
VPLETFASAGQVLAIPLQLSSTSQLPAAVRHTVPLLTTTSAGHAAPLPEHTSAMSHPPGTAARQVVPAATNASLGQVWALPLQVSATSQPPAAAARQVVPAAFATQVESTHVAHASHPGLHVVPHTSLVSPVIARSSIEYP